MARFRGTLQGTRGEASRLGTVNSGLTANVNGWELGVRVDAIATTSEKDVFVVTATRGSNGGGNSVRLGTVRLVDEKIVFEPEGRAA